MDLDSLPYAARRRIFDFIALQASARDQARVQSTDNDARQEQTGGGGLRGHDAAHDGTQGAAATPLRRYLLPRLTLGMAIVDGALSATQVQVGCGDGGGGLRNASKDPEPVEARPRTHPVQNLVRTWQMQGVDAVPHAWLCLVMLL